MGRHAWLDSLPVPLVFTDCVVVLNPGCPLAILRELTENTYAKGISPQRYLVNYPRISMSLKNSLNVSDIQHRSSPAFLYEIHWMLLFKIQILLSWLVWLSGLSDSLQTKGSWVWFPVRAHAWVVGQVPSGGHVRGNYTLMFLSLSSSLLPPLSKNK